MSKDNNGDSFDIKKLGNLLKMMEEHGVTEVNLRSAKERWVIRRGPREVHKMQTMHVPAGMPAAPPVAPQPVPAAPPAAETPAAAPAEDTGTYILSPAVGTFYVAPSPDDPPFVKVGDTVTPDTVVCIVEAMKVHNEIRAGLSGVIEAVIPKNEDPVDVDAKLFRVKPG